MSMIGRTLGNFELTSQIGKGGMGEVYQAKDHKLGRDVAIKVLPEEFARDSERVAVRGGRKVKHVAVEKCNTWYEVICFSFPCPYLAAE
jgi:serine/threonine protein kinase